MEAAQLEQERQDVHLLIALGACIVGLAYVPTKGTGGLVAAVGFFLAFFYCLREARWTWAACVAPIAIVWAVVDFGKSWPAHITHGIFLAGLLYWIAREAVRTKLEWRADFYKKHPGFSTIYAGCAAFNIETREVALLRGDDFDIKPFSYLRNVQLSNETFKVTIYLNDMERATYTVSFNRLSSAKAFEHRVRLVTEAQNAAS